MSDVVIIGAGAARLLGAVLPPPDGHEGTPLGRDPHSPPPAPGRAPGPVGRRGRGLRGVPGGGPGAGGGRRADVSTAPSGRRSAVTRWLSALGAAAPHEELDDCGFIYSGRHYRSADGSLPPALGPGLQHYDSFS